VGCRLRQGQDQRRGAGQGRLQHQIARGGDIGYALDPAPRPPNHAEQQQAAAPVGEGGERLGKLIGPGALAGKGHLWAFARAEQVLEFVWGERCRGICLHLTHT
jgi:hypothetical protein